MHPVPIHTTPAGVTINTLLRNNIHRIIGALYPITALGQDDAVHAQQARSALEGGVLADNMCSTELDQLLHRGFVSVLGSMVLMAIDQDSCPGQPCPPGVPVPHVLAAAEKLMPSAADLHAQLTAATSAALLCKCHKRLHATAATPRHMLVALTGPVAALLALLGSQAAQPLPFHYACHILLPLLDMRCACVAGCVCLFVS